MLIDSLAAVVAQHAEHPGFFKEPGSRLADLVQECAIESSSQEMKRNKLKEDLGVARPERLGSAVRVLSGDDIFAETRTAVIAQWSADGVIAPYLIYYLRKLREEGWKIILTCGELPRVDSPWPELCDAVIARTCSGYDFTSWKAAFEVFPSLYCCKEVLCTNDSLFGPVNPLSFVHTIMNDVPCDFWGLVESREKRPHLQSYYLLFRKQTIRHPAFAVFWSAVDRSGEKFDAVLRYEVTLSSWLTLHGLRAGAFVPATALPQTNINPSHYFWKQLLLLYKAPFIKRDLLRQCANHPFLAGWKDILRAAGYDPALIQF